MRSGQFIEEEEEVQLEPEQVAQLALAIDARSRLLNIKARNSFLEFRRRIHPELIVGWWVRELAHVYEEFYDDLVDGERPIYVIEAPPQHGKSMATVDFIAWASGKNPKLKTMYTAYGEGLGERANKSLQRIMDAEPYQDIFPFTQLSSARASYLTHYERSSSLLEFVAQNGSFRNSTINGQTTGHGLELGCIDDPLKGREAANSITIRNKVWDWFTDDFFTRFADSAGLLMSLTRWHIDDPVARLIEKFGKYDDGGQVKVVKYPALALRDEYIGRKLVRRKGEALFPEHKSKDFILERKKLMSNSSFEALYQQNPIVTGGELFPIEKFQIINNLDEHQISNTIRFWDKAGTQDGGAYSAGVLMHKMADGTFVVADVRRGQWSALKREEHIKQCAKLDNATTPMRTWVEQEPGSGGKESAESTIRNLAGYSVYADKVTGSKEVRAAPYSAQVEKGNVKLLNAPWVQAFLDEHEEFPNGKYKDQVDAAAGAFNKLTVGSTYDSSLEWVGV